MTETIQKKIKIGKATIGLIGLDQAMLKALEQKLTVNEATEFLYQTVSKNNYIPSAVTKQYKEALGKEYERARSGADIDHQQMTIKILGSGCVSCNKMNTMIFDIMQRLDMAADIEHIHDLDEIWRHGVINTPALIINGEIQCSGRMPTPAEIEQWLVKTM